MQPPVRVAQEVGKGLGGRPLLLGAVPIDAQFSVGADEAGELSQSLKSEVHRAEILGPHVVLG